MMLWKGVFAMLVIPIRRICDAKMKQIMDGYTAYSESKQVINKLKKRNRTKKHTSYIRLYEQRMLYNSNKKQGGLI